MQVKKESNISIKKNLTPDHNRLVNKGQIFFLYLW